MFHHIYNNIQINHRCLFEFDINKRTPLPLLKPTMNILSNLSSLSDL